MMQAAVEHALDAWEGFYLIVGGAGAALTGLQFVVMTLIDGARSRGHGSLTTNPDPSTVGAFGTPTVVHFCAALLIAGILTAPWETVGGVRTALVLPGAAGLAYAVVITLRARRQTGYKPVLEDWLFHSLFPIAAYGGIVAGAAMFSRHMSDGLFLVGGMTLFLLFIGIHNAWDTVTYLLLDGQQDTPGAPATSPNPPRPKAQGGRNRRRR